MKMERAFLVALLASNTLAACADVTEGDELALEGVAQAIVVSIPAVIEAENFERFADSDGLHEGNCGTGPVDAEVTTDVGGGCNVGWTKAGEWLEYDVQTSGGSYTLSARVASAIAGRGFHVTIDGTDVTGRLTAPSAGWQAFEDRVSQAFTLGAGSHVVRVLFEDGDVNLNHLTFRAAPSPQAVALPGRFEAEDYARALELTPADNAGFACDRADGVDKEATNDPLGGVCNIGWTSPGEWLAYDVHAASAGTFAVGLRLASGSGARNVAVLLDGVSVGSVTTPNAGWQAFETRTLTGVTMAAGNHELRVVFTDGDANLNFLEVTRTDTPPTGVRLPARIQAEDYTAFVDLTVGNTGTACDRGDDVDKEVTSDPTGGQCNVGWMDAGERLDYAVFADAASRFDVGLRVAGTGGVLRVELDGANVGSVTVNTGGWQTWTTLMVPNLTVGAGGHTLRVVVVSAGANLNYLDVQAQSAGGDRDGDRLPDSVETHTGVFAGLGNTGTNPDSPDTDGDGITDGDEVLGTTAGLNLPSMGVSPVHKDILLEYDWFDDASYCAYHSHKPTEAMLDRVAQMFANAPVANPDGASGIHLVQDVGQFGGGNYIPDADGIFVGAVYSAEFQNYKSANMASNRYGYFHYTIFGHEYSDWPGSSGYAEIYGDDLIVTLGCLYNETSYVANTIAHELGHNLNLWHGGNEGYNDKPNYNSVMNYRYQFGGIDVDCDSYADGVLDYSVGDRVTLDENNLDERAGVCGTRAIDFNFNGAIEASVAQDLNYDGYNGVLSDHDDWANIVYDWDANTFAGGRTLRSVVDGVACPGPSEL